MTVLIPVYLLRNTRSEQQPGITDAPLAVFSFGGLKLQSIGFRNLHPSSLQALIPDCELLALPAHVKVLALVSETTKLVLETGKTKKSIA